MPRLAPTIAAALLTLPAAADTVDATWDAPTLDRWMYPFNASPGFSQFASVFGTIGEVDFDDRDGQMIVGYDTTDLITPGLGAAAYDIQSLTLTVEVRNDLEFGYDPTSDPWQSWLDSGDPDFVADPDDGRAVELFGAGFRNGFTAQTFVEAGPYSFVGPFGEGIRNVYALAFDGGAPIDVSNNVRDMFDPTPWAVATAPLAQGDPVPSGTEFTFVVDTNDPNVRAYLQSSLDAGMLDLVIASIFPAVQQGDSGFPRFFLKEDPLVDVGVASAARLNVVVDIDASVPGDVNGDGVVDVTDLLELLANWGACAACAADLDGDGFVDVDDMLIVLAAWS